MLPTYGKLFKMCFDGVDFKKKKALSNLRKRGKQKDVRYQE